jgi:DNA-binding NarL/FixJ family response regulator
VKDKDSPRALVVDDDPFVRGALTRFLGDAGYEVSEARNGEDGVVLAGSLRPDVILMDVMMPPGISGIEATRRIIERDPTARVVMFSVHQSEDVVGAAVAAGAAGYVTKETPLPTLLDAIARTIDGQSILIPSPQTPAALRGGSPLGPRAQQILDFAVSGLTARQIGERLGLSPRTVENHLRDIYLRLGVNNRAQLVRAAVGGQLVTARAEAVATVEPPAARRLELTATERQIAGLVSQALTNQQIAHRLDMSPHTVNYHLRQIFQKLGVSSRVELARLVQDGNLGQVPTVAEASSSLTDSTDQ